LPPRLRSTATRTTGGSIGVQWDLPEDTGGYHEDLGYILFYRKVGGNERFRRAQQVVSKHNNGTIFALLADTEYEIFALTTTTNSSTPTTNGTLQLDDAAIVVTVDMTDDLAEDGYFEFAVRFLIMTKLFTLGTGR
jgi:hypothetical protein